MALEAEQAVGQRVVALLLQQRDRQEFALRLRHFAGGSVQMQDVHPVIAPVVAKISLRLGDLVRVMRESVVDAAAVDVEVLAEVFDGNTGALDVPARIADAPRRVPLERLILKLGLREPEHKIVLVALVRVLLHALADADGEILCVMIVEDIVAFELGGVEIDISPRLIGVAGVHQLGDDLDILVDAVGRRLHDVRPLDVELLAVGKEGVRVELCDLHDGLVLALCALDHLVLALVGVGCQMADVRDVHDALDVVAAVAQVLFEHVLHDVAAEVADVGEVIDRRAAGVHFDNVRVIRDEFFLFMRCRVIEIHFASSCR